MYRYAPTLNRRYPDIIDNTPYETVQSKLTFRKTRLLPNTSEHSDKNVAVCDAG